MVELHDLLLPNETCNNTQDLVVVQNASFAWKIGGVPAIRDVTFALKRCQFTFVIGPVGSGKSTLLKGLLGETPSSQGFVYSDSMQAAYVDQTPWIRNSTVRDNILGVSIFERSWYHTIVHVCALDKDIAIMAKGDGTPVGSAGISLSGGQKQRLALARALYSKKTLIILDDVFSGLDPQTEERVFSRLMGHQGLLRKMKTTVLLVTHAVHRLAYSDYIIALDAMGGILEQGSLRDLRKLRGYVHDLTVGQDRGLEQQMEEPVLQAPLPPPPAIDEIDSEVADLNRQTGELAVYRYYLSSLGWGHIAVYSIGIILFGVSNKLSQLVVTLWTNAVSNSGNSVNSFYLAMYGLLCGVTIASLNGTAW